MSAEPAGDGTGEEDRVLFLPRASTGWLAGAAFMSVLTCALVWQDNLFFALVFDVVLAALALIAAVLALRYLLQSVGRRDGGVAQHAVELVLIAAVALPVIQPFRVVNLVQSLRHWVNSF